MAGIKINIKRKCFPDPKRALEFQKNRIKKYLSKVNKELESKSYEDNKKSLKSIENELNVYGCISGKNDKEYNELCGQYEETCQLLEHERQKKESANELIEIQNHRDQLEVSIVSLIGGKTGMSITWGEIMKWASKGDVENFHCYADTFPEKVKRLKMAYDELKAVIEIEDQKYKKTFRNNELLRECESLIKNSKSLEKILHNGTISKEDLRNWYEKN